MFLRISIQEVIFSPAVNATVIELSFYAVLR